MASAELSRRVENVVGYPPLSEMSDEQRREYGPPLLHRRSSAAVDADHGDCS
jgi:hypothetical protein